jgi:putative membrane protein
MIQEALLAYLHIGAILAWVVFLTSTAALARVEWMNAAALERLVRVDRIAALAGAAVLATGLARSVWGLKGAAWYWQQPLLWGKLALVLAMAGVGIAITRQIARWHRHHQRTGQLPEPAAIARLRRQVMWSSHLTALLPLLGVLLARGIGTR